MTNTKKALPDDIDNFFEGESVFFQKPEEGVEPQSPTPLPEQTAKSALHSSLPASDEDTSLAGKQPLMQPSSTSNMNEINTEGVIDVMTSLLQDVNIREWREIIQNTETQNTALRLTNEERYAVEDVVNELRRKEKVKTSMNEIARLGIIFIIYDFKKNGHASLLYKVKKA